MRDLLKSLLRTTWAGGIYALHQAANTIGPETTASFERLAEDAAEKLAVPPPPTPAATPAPRSAPSFGSLDLTRMVVLGESLAAGFGDFSLSAASQKVSFPACLAQHAGIGFQQPLFEAPGLGSPVGFSSWPVIVPNPLQSTVLEAIPAPPAANLSVPGFTLADAIGFRPREPMIQPRRANKDNAKQTLANLILGVRDFAYGMPRQPASQLECALDCSPTFAIVEHGFTEFLLAAIAADPGLLPDLHDWLRNFRLLLERLRGTTAELLALTIPDPFDTAYFATLESAAALTRTDPALLREFWGLTPDCLITVHGLNEIAYQIFARQIAPLSSDHTIPLAAAHEISRLLREFNHAIAEVAAHQGAVLYDLNNLYARLKNTGLQAGTRTLTGQYLGGFYSLNGYTPGATGHALIASEIMALLATEFGAQFPPIDFQSIEATDPVAQYRPASGGPNWTRAQLSNSRPPSKETAHPPTILTRQLNQNLPLRLPPNLELILPLNPALSYFGDGIAALNDRTPQNIQWGSGGNLLFGGLAMVDSCLTGFLHIRFTPPENGISKFIVSFGDGLLGADAVLATPQFFRMPFLDNRVQDIPGFVSSGFLNLNTGQVDPTAGEFSLYAGYSSTALNALVQVNPSFPAPPAAPLSFPGKYGSANTRFEQRPDGGLDFTFYGSTFVPLGPGIVWPLNFVGPNRQFATIPANGTALHPHLALSTKQPVPITPLTNPPAIPVNTLEDQTLFSPVSSFGDLFTLQAPQLGGSALGRSRLIGRMQIQFGPKCGDIVPIAIATTCASGVLVPLDPTPIAQLFPGRLTPGPEGFDADLRFPLRTYSLNDLSVIDDPFDISIGALDTRTGRLVHPLLHRAFINQDLIFALLRVEPRTPGNSFFFLGDGIAHTTPNGAFSFQYFGDVHIPYPEGFLFPDANLATGFRVGPKSALDPYIWFWGLSDVEKLQRSVYRSGTELVSTRGERFSYTLRLHGDSSDARAEFEYVNHSQEGSFRMHSLASVAYGSAMGGSRYADPEHADTISFSGFGIWSKDGLQQIVQVAAQLFESAEANWVGIQIGQADISDVETPLPKTFYPIPPPTTRIT